MTKIIPIDSVYRDSHRKRDNDDDYCAWLRTQRSAFSGCKRKIVAAHFRTAENSGIAINPLFSAIPLTDDEYQTQHRVGQFAFASRGWWIAEVKRHQQMFIIQGGVIPVRYLV